MSLFRKALGKKKKSDKTKYIGTLFRQKTQQQLPLEASFYHYPNNGNFTDTYNEYFDSTSSSFEDYVIYPFEDHQVPKPSMLNENICPEFQYLQHWVGLDHCNIVYDSDNQQYTMKAFQQSLYGKRHITVIIITEYGDVFGLYHDLMPKKSRKSRYGRIKVSTEKEFMFSLQNMSKEQHEPSKHNRNQRKQTRYSILFDEGEEFKFTDKHDWVYYYYDYLFGIRAPLNENTSYMYQRVPRYFEGCTINTFTSQVNFTVQRLIAVEWW
ncbi:TLDc domain-containing protein [Entamoeba marina]